MAEEKLREYLKRVTSDLHRARLRVKELENQSTDPVAIVGMSCRFPGGVTSPAGLWDVVCDGVDAMSPFPVDRGWDVAGLGLVGVGGFLADAGGFDSGFFGISPREALAMDPQQRLMLECVWEALESGGFDPLELRGGEVGVFVGTNGQDYPGLLAGAVESAEVAGHVVTGNAASVLSGRVSYVLGLEGPAVSVDTACSSSLVALHLAAQALRRGECSLALAGGVTVMSTPGGFVEFARQNGLAADGRCKAFAEAADGTGWGEGVGVLVVERLADARRLGHDVLAVVRGSAVNQDGASSSLTAPNGPSQQRAIRRALVDAGLSGSDVDVVEAHGTGTRLGDPIEAQALLATYGQDRDRPLLLGSVKSNIGHTQAAAGVAGVIKMIEAMRHGTVPATLHVDAPSSHVDWTSGAVQLATETQAWPVVDRPRRAGVSSFGISGTNAHVILEQAPDQVGERVESGVVVPWVVSGRDEVSLRAQCARLAEWATDDPISTGWSLASGRAGLGQRAVVVGADREELLAGLATPAVSGRVQGEGRVGVVFSGQGSQAAGMGTVLAGRYPVFADALDEVCALLDPGVREAMATGVGLERTEFTQPALFAYGVAMYRLLVSWGVAVEAVMGHSVGEVTAAYVAGLWSLEDACRVISARARLMQALPAGGVMAALHATEAEVLPLLSAGVSVAAVNGPTAVVVSGEQSAVAGVVDTVSGWGRKTRYLPVSHAFHSSLMEPMLDEFRAVLETVEFRPLDAGPALISHRTSDVAWVDYWTSHVRDTVRFAEDVTVMAERGVEVAVEIGPRPALSGEVAAVLPVAPLARDKVSEDRAVLIGLGRLWCQGVQVDWPAVFDGLHPHRVPLPTYAFQHQRYWPQHASSIDDRRYSVHWVPVQATGSEPELQGTWAVVGDEATAVADLCAAIRSAGADAVVVDRVAGRIPFAADGVVAVMGGESDSRDAVEVLWRLIALAQTTGEIPLWCVTRGGVVATEGESLTSPVSTGLWGLGRVIGLERGAGWGGLIDVLPDADAATWSTVVEVLAGSGEKEVAVRPTGMFGRRLMRAEPVATAGIDAVDLVGGTVLVTGGTGALGGHVARWLADRGAARIVLLGRSGKIPGELRNSLEARNVQVDAVACDVTDQVALREVVNGIDGLCGVVHAAGVVEDVRVADTSRSDFERVATVKVQGGWNLHEVTRDLDLRVFVTFSSVSAIWGAGGQCAYAAGNAFLNGLVAYRRALGLAGSSFAWGPWAGGGMVADPEIAAQLQKLGLNRMSPENSIKGLDIGIDSGAMLSIVADVEWSRLAPPFETVGLSDLFTDIPEAAEALQTPAPTASDGLAGRLSGLSVDGQRRLVSGLVRECVAGVLGYAPGSVDMGVSYKGLGFDSLTAVELCSALRLASGVAVSRTVVFDFPTPVATVGHVVELLGGGESGRVVGSAGGGSVGDDDVVVVVGMSCRLPGGVVDVAGLWELVVAGDEGVGGFPGDRGWDVGGLVGVGGFVGDVGGFDAGFFGISPREALAMDPQQRLVLECAWEALESAGIAPDSLRGTETGVFAGMSHQDYGPRLHEPADSSEGYLLTGNAAAVLSGRVSYVLGLEGPAVSVDTACSSSLVALHLAVQALRRGECSLALAGGVTVMATPGAFIEFGRQGGLAADGRCKAFAEAADGTGWAEGVGVLVVERLSDARRLGHEVLAVVRGSAVNQDGASNGLTAPNGPSQQRVIRRALADAGLSASDVDVVEAHGTGTRLGDPIEAQALLATYGQDRQQPLLLGSVKSNIGHTQAAAGVAGVIKMIEAMRHGTVPATLHVDAPSSHVDWTSGAVQLATEIQPWPVVDRPRRAGVSSFGISGTNAHVILEQAPDQAGEQVESDVVVPWVVSGRDEVSLRAQCARLAEWASGDPVSVGWSLASGRAGLEQRAVVVGADRDELIAGLGAPAVSGRVQGEGRVGVVFSGQGSQVAGMGTVLAGRYPVFAAALDEVCALLDPGVREAMATGVGLERTEFTQPALFAYEVAMYRLLCSLGVTVEAVMGHSVGEVTAAYVAGLWSLSDACRVISARARLMQALPADGVMAAVHATEGEVVPLLGAGVSIAAVNGPTAVVVSGEQPAVASVVDTVSGWGRKNRYLPVSHAFHSSLMEPMLDEFRAVLETVEFRSLGEGPALISHRTSDVGWVQYWTSHVRDTVRFAEDVGVMAERGIEVAVEIGPRPALSGEVAVVLPVAPLARDKVSEDRAVLTGLGRLWCQGVQVDWPAVFDGLHPHRVPLPTYAFQHQHYWLAESSSESATVVDGGVDEQFWEAVHRLDAAHLATELGLEDQAGLEALLPALSSWRRRQDKQQILQAMGYQVEWTPIDVRRQCELAGSRWLVLTTEGKQNSATSALIEAISSRHVEIDIVEVSPGTSDRSALAKLLSGLSGRFDRVVSLLALQRDVLRSEPAADIWLTTATMLLLQALGDADITAPLWCVTRNAVALAPDGIPTDPGQAPIWGLGRSAALEYPRRWGGLIDLPIEPAGYQLELCCDVVNESNGEDQLAIRARTAHARRLARYRGGRTDEAQWQPHGTVLVSGGTGALGTEVARWLARNGAEHILLLSRNGASDELGSDLRAEFGTEVTIARCDVADYESLAEVLDEIPEQFPLTAVVHAAGVLDDGVLETMTPQQLRTVLAPKVDGAWNLHQLTEKCNLDRFIMFSSVAATWGNAGQANYAAANAYLDALAGYRRTRALTASTIAWGPWATSGMAAGDAVTKRMAKVGMTAFPPEQALEVFRSAFQASDLDREVAVIDLDLPRFIEHFTASRPSTLFAGLTSDDDTETALPEPEESLRSKLAGMKPSDRDHLLLTSVCGTVAAILGHRSADVIGPQRRFTDLGFDSLTAVELRNQLAASTGLTLSAALVFDYPTPADLADYLKESLFPEKVEDAFETMSADDLVRMALGAE